MRTSESGATVLRKSSDRSRAPRPPKPPGVKPPPKGGRWPSSQEEAAARKGASQTSYSATGWSLPAATPATVKSRVSCLHHNQTCDRTWQVPCWLASLLLHLLAVVVLGSLTVPVSRHRTIVSLLLSFGDLTSEADDGPVELAAAIETTSPATPRDDADDGLFAVDVSPPPEPSISPIPTEPARPKEQTPAPAEEAAKAAGDVPGEAPSGQSDAQGGAERMHVVDRAEPAHDEVVDRFIRFDIGELQGEEGLRARDDFQRLGADAMRSLVRGLNRSASIHASCPVMVITYKIEGVLRENSDPELVKYAIDHIGQGVPASAPHYRRLRTFLSQLRRFGQNRPSPKVKSFEAQVQSQDRQRILKAMQSVVANSDSYTALEKREIAWTSIRLLHHRYPNIRAAAHEALVALAGGQDLGPDNDRRADDRFAAAGAWALHFNPNRYEATAAAALKNGEHLEEAGKREAALRQYQKVVREYPGTAAADGAARNLEAPKSFAFKMTAP